jgi:hypothetical protein
MKDHFEDKKRTIYLMKRKKKRINLFKVACIYNRKPGEKPKQISLQ